MSAVRSFRCSNASARSSLKPCVGFMIRSMIFNLRECVSRVVGENKTLTTEDTEFHRGTPQRKLLPSVLVPDSELAARTLQRAQRRIDNHVQHPRSRIVLQHRIRKCASHYRAACKHS